MDFTFSPRQQPFAFTQTGYQGGFTGAITKTAGTTIFNLYTNPQEDDSIGVRHIPMGVPLQTEVHNYMEILKNIRRKHKLNCNTRYMNNPPL